MGRWGSGRGRRQGWRGWPHAGHCLRASYPLEECENSLHFHFPRAVHIYDERANRAIRLIKPRLRLRTPTFDRYDNTYAKFVHGCEPLQEELERLLGRAVTPSDLDKVLLAVADRTT